MDRILIVGDCFIIKLILIDDVSYDNYWSTDQIIKDPNAVFYFLNYLPNIQICSTRIVIKSFVRPLGALNTPLLLEDEHHPGKKHYVYWNENQSCHRDDMNSLWIGFAKQFYQ